jgi:hypothetical protein
MVEFNRVPGSRGAESLMLTLMSHELSSCQMLDRLTRQSRGSG